MNSLEKKHLAAINGNVSGYQQVDDSDPILIAGKELAAKESAEITIEFAGKFAEWVDFGEMVKENGIRHQQVSLLPPMN